MQKKKKDFPRTEFIGTVQYYGAGQHRILTQRGWVICDDNTNELENEQREIESLIKRKEIYK